MTLLPLCRIQHELEVTTKQAIFVDSSISDTIRTCIVLGNHRAAMKVKTEFKVGKILTLTLIVVLERKRMGHFVPLSINSLMTRKSKNVKQMKHFLFPPIFSPL